MKYYLYEFLAISIIFITLGGSQQGGRDRPPMNSFNDRSPMNGGGRGRRDAPPPRRGGGFDQRRG